MEATLKHKGFSRSKIAESCPQATNPTSHQKFGSRKVSLIPQPTEHGSARGFTHQNRKNYPSLQKVSPYSARGYADENIDLKATSYISYVRERFKREIDS
ncbi:hypothetical protein QQP08_022040 [Theobroma cacao]|uniref:Uncharacterized protein n=1 Tax=Theobroma cacao TaxID=3641 RepID=A0A061F8B3_THECC|nr:Uncharacterized protein TCM_031455 [Theobroma cacao]WRX29553.1 hypothetical protein QQP08_022040 [Theobroma cacao]